MSFIPLANGSGADADEILPYRGLLKSPKVTKVYTLV
jgi:hypothetical protein